MTTDQGNSVLAEVGEDLAAGEGVAAASAGSGVLLEATQVAYAYGAIKALNGVDLIVNDAEGVCVIGPNGAGKTTLARVLGGIYQPSSGLVLFRGVRISHRTHRMVRSGVASVLEGRRLFAAQSVRVNLELGSYAVKKGRPLEERLGEVFALFPKLAQRLDQRAGTLSGGEQQMVAIGRALMADPALLILDEPSMGLAPKVAGEVFDALLLLKSKGLAILLVEQNAELAFELADRSYVLQYGCIAASGTVDEMRQLDHIKKSYLGSSSSQLDAIAMEGGIDSTTGTGDLATRRAPPP